MASESNPVVRSPRLLVCEGPEDEFFFRKLIYENNLPEFLILNAKGKGNIAGVVNSFKVTQTKIFNSILDTLFVGDNDETPDENFAEMCRQIERIYGTGRAPAAPLTKVARGPTYPSITVLMIPDTGTRGHLEKLCIDAARSGNGIIAGEVDTFMNLVHADRWPSESRRAKAWLRSNLAARCEKDPFVPLGEVFRKRKYADLIPISHRSFKPIVDVLRGIP